MNIRLHKKINAIKKYLRNNWFSLMKPIATYLYNLQDKAHQRKVDRITKDQAVKWIAEDIVKYLVNHNEEIYFIIADYISDDDLSGYVCLGNRCSYMIKRKKTRRAYYKFKWNTSLQEEVIEQIKSIEGIKLTKEIEEFTWQRLSNYKATYIIESY